jgi:hypothetical protein
MNLKVLYLDKALEELQIWRLGLMITFMCFPFTKAAVIAVLQKHHQVRIVEYDSEVQGVIFRINPK